MAPDRSDRDPSSDPTGRAAIESFEFETAFKIVNARIDELARKPRRNKSEALSHHLNSRGWLHLQLGRYSAAVADCTEARRLNPNLDQNNLMLARLFGDYYDSIIRPEMERLADGLVPDACRSIALAYYQAGFYAHAASYLELAIVSAKASELPELYNDLAGAYYGADLPIEALQASAKAVSLDPGIDRTNFEQALQALEAMHQNPSVFLAGILDRPASTTGDGGAVPAQPRAEAPRGTDSGDLDTRIDEARARNGRGDRGSSTMELVRLLILRSRARLNRKEFDEAIADTLEARSLDPHVGHSDLRLAQFFRARYEQMLEPLFDRVHKGPTTAAYMDLGLAFFEHGQLSNAATYFQLAAAAAAGERLEWAEALNNLAGTYLESNLPVAGLRTAAQAVALNPDISKVNFNLALMRLKPMGLDPDMLLKDRSETIRTSH